MELKAEMIALQAWSGFYKAILSDEFYGGFQEHYSSSPRNILNLFPVLPKCYRCNSK